MLPEDNLLTPPLVSHTKRFRTPSPVREVDQQIVVLQQLKDRIELASISPEVFLPQIVFDRHPSLSKKYKLMSDLKFVDISDVENTIEKLQEHIIHSLVISQEGHFVLVTQFEVYVKDKELDDVAIINKLEKAPKTLRTELQTCQEGKNAWKELRLLSDLFEVVVTGSLYRSYTDCSGFLGVSVPEMLCNDSNLLLFPPVISAQAVSCIRMIRKYMKKQGSECQLRKSKYLADIGFTTPSPLLLDNHDPPLIAICSKITRHAAHGTSNGDVLMETKKLLKKTKYWQQSGFDKAPSAKKVLEKLKEIKADKKHELSQAKRLLIEIVLDCNAVNTSDLLTVYNGILYPEVKRINKLAVKSLIQAPFLYMIASKNVLLL